MPREKGRGARETYYGVHVPATKIQGVFNLLNVFFLNRRMLWEEVVGHAMELTKAGLAKREAGTCP